VLEFLGDDGDDSLQWAMAHPDRDERSRERVRILSSELGAVAAVAERFGVTRRYLGPVLPGEKAVTAKLRRSSQRSPPGWTGRTKLGETEPHLLLRLNSSGGRCLASMTKVSRRRG
jgi:hypothetical protein